MKKVEMVKGFFSSANKGQEKEYKKIKSDNIKSVTPHKVLRTIIWILIAFLVIRGVASLFGKSSSESVETAVQKQLLVSEKQDQIKSEAAAFAEGFSEEYMTYKLGNTEEYQKRLSKYLPSYLSSIGQNISGSCDVQAVGATAISCDFYSANQINVDVRVKVEYLQQAANSNKENDNKNVQIPTQIYNDIFLRVPIVENGGKFVIEDLPMVIPIQGVASLDVNNYSGTSAEDTETAEIKKMLQNFLQTYCEGNDTELNYFMSDSNVKVKGLKGSFKFKSVDDIRAFYMKDKSSYLVLCSYTVVDSNSSQELKQDIHIDVIKRDGRYYVKSFDTRMINLSIEGGKN